MSLMKRLEEISEEKKVSKPGEKPIDPNVSMKAAIQNKVIQDLDIDFDQLNDMTEETKLQIDLDIMKHIDLEAPGMSPGEKKKIKEELMDEITGFGPITSLLNNSAVTEIMVNGPDHVYIEQKGRLVLSNAKFKNDNHVLHVIKKIVAPIGRRIDESSPMVDARLPNGSRVNAIIPPLALDGPSITIRKFAEDPFKIQDLVNFGTLNYKMAQILRMCVEGRLNIVVSGGTGSGKTTTLNVLSSFIPEHERIVTIEDAAELQLGQEHLVRLETRPANVEGRGEVTIRDLVKNSLRMRPDRVIVGEVRSGEALDMLQAMNTGHDGSLTTGHANTPRDMLSRLETMVLMSGMNLPIKAIRDQISSAVNLIVQQSRLQDGSRKITHITEVQGMEGDVIVLQDVFRYVQKGADDNGKLIGGFEYSGVVPKFVKMLQAKGIHLPPDLLQ